MNIIVSAGGTGGHINPAIALINEFKKQEKDLNVLYIGTHNRMEKNIVPKLGIKYMPLEIYGFSKTQIIRDFKDLFLIRKAINKCNKTIDEFKPDVVIGAGGYVTMPVIYSAKKKKIPTVILEQNSIPGKTNKALSKNCDLVCTSYENSNKYFSKAKKCVCTGNPVDLKFDGMKKESLGFHKNKKLLLIVSGSLGSETLNNFFISLLSKINEEDNYEVLYITGKSYYDEFINNKTFSKNIKILPFLDNMSSLFGDVDLIISRAGASTLAEIMNANLPSIIIPSPYVTGNHQYYNALDLVQRGLAKMYEEKDLNVQTIYNDINNLLTNDSMEYKTLKKNLSNLNKVKSSEIIYNEIRKIIK